MRTQFMLLLAAAIAIVSFGCGGSGGSATAAASVRLLPEFTLVGGGDTVDLIVETAGLRDRTVNWAATGGTITVTGPTTAVYTAPTQTGNYQITVSSQENPGLQSNATITVAPPGVSLQAASTNIVTSASTDVVATVIALDDKRVSWSVSGGTFTEIAPGSITYTAPEQPGSYTVTATSVANPSLSASVTVEVVERLAVVRGRVRARRDAGIGVVGVIVVFFDGNGTEVARATTNSDGSFGQEVPMSARRFHLVPSTIDSTYYHEYTYGTLVYDADVDTCRAPLPDVRGQLEVQLPNEIVLTERTQLPPVPTGCS